MKIVIYPDNSFSEEDDDKKEYKFHPSFEFPQIMEKYGVQERRRGTFRLLDSGIKIVVNNVQIVMFPNFIFDGKHQLSREKAIQMNKIKREKQDGKTTDN